MPKSTRRKRLKQKRSHIKRRADYFRMLANRASQHSTYLHYLLKDPKNLVQSICPVLFEHCSTGKTVSEPTVRWIEKEKIWGTVYRGSHPFSRFRSGVILNAKFEGGHPRICRADHAHSFGLIHGNIRKGHLKPDHYVTAIEVFGSAYAVAYDDNLCCYMTVANRTRVDVADLAILRHDGSVIACWFD